MTIASPDDFSYDAARAAWEFYNNNRAMFESAAEFARTMKAWLDQMAPVQAAIDRGELPTGTPPDLIIDAIMGRVISLIVLTPGAQRSAISASREHYAASVTDFVLVAISGASASHHS